MTHEGRRGAREGGASVPVRFGDDHGVGSMVRDVAHRLEVALNPIAADRSREPTTDLGRRQRSWVVGDVTLPPAPEVWRVEAAVLRALHPRHVLFLCVANSARSQLAEGIGRRLAGMGVRISSAGSAPTSVRPEAIGVLEEIGIDASGQWSKGVESIERPVDAVVTLCAEEACPLWLEPAWRLHWPLEDPAPHGGRRPRDLEVFRRVRDTLVERLGVLFGTDANRTAPDDG